MAGGSCFVVKVALQPMPARYDLIITSYRSIEFALLCPIVMLEVRRQPGGDNTAQ